MLKRNLIANYLGQGWVALMGLAFIPLYIKYLGIEAYGLIGLFAVLQAWLILLDMGMTPALGREMARFTGGSHSNESIRDLLRSIEIIALGIALLIAGSVALGSNWIATSWLKAESLPVDVVAQALAIMGLVSALRFVEGVYRSAIVGLQRQVLFNVVNSIVATLRGLGSVAVLAWLSPTIEAFFLWQGLVSVVSLAILYTYTYAWLPKSDRGGRFSLHSLQGVWRFAGGVFLMTTLGLLLTQLDKVLLPTYISLTEYGYYMFAVTYAAAIQIFVSPIIQAYQPRITELYSRASVEEYRNDIYSMGKIISILISGLFIIVILNAETVIFMLSRDRQFVEKVEFIFILLLAGNLFSSLNATLLCVQLSIGWTRLMVVIQSISLLFYAPLMLVILPNYGTTGAAWLFFGLAGIVVSCSWYFTFSRLDFIDKWNYFGIVIAKPLFISMVTIFSLRSVLPQPDGIAGSVIFLGIMAAASIISNIMLDNYLRNKLLNLLGCKLLFGCCRDVSKR